MKKAIDGAHYASLEDDSMSLVSAFSASSGVVEPILVRQSFRGDLIILASPIFINGKFENVFE